ncbi:fumarate hydratase [Muricoccus radiodurans]|uniref:fumarate hydratase n=1 Tax=Muricoccus radiodurans TaxID=2231721 RepID=UPI003CF1D4F4
MAVTYEMVRDAASQLYGWALKKVPDDTKDALARALENESNEAARRTLRIMLQSARAAESTDRLVCSDAGVPVYFVEIGTAVRMEGDIKRAISDGFDHLVETIHPPILKHVTNPLTLERGYKGKDMPLITWSVKDGVDYMEMTCSPKALGTGRWAALEIFSYPNLEQIESYIMDVVMKAGSQHCPPVIIGVGIGGSFDVCAKMSKMATLRPMGQTNPEPILAAMEERLTKAVNALGYGPMGTGGDTTALAVHIDYASGHGFTPVAVSFNCWINRRSRARLHNSGEIERLE